MGHELIVLQLGGSIITYRGNDIPQLNSNNIKIIISEIKKAKEKKEFDLILIHGMGSFGHPIAKKYNIHNKGDEKEKIRGTSILKHSLQQLNNQIIKLFLEEDLPVLRYEDHIVLTNGKIKEMQLSALAKYLELGFIPILQAHPVYDNTEKISILSSDHLAPYIAKIMNAELLIMGTSVGGVYDKNPKEPDAKLLKKLSPPLRNNYKAGISGSQFTDVTGGMQRKISELLDFAEQGVKAVVMDVTTPNMLCETIIGIHRHGTIITKD